MMHNMWLNQSNMLLIVDTCVAGVGVMYDFYFVVKRMSYNFLVLTVTNKNDMNYISRINNRHQLVF